MEIKKIYFDMDGVLANFDKGVKELCGIAPVDQAHSTESEIDALWDAVRGVSHFYGRLEPIPGTLKLFDTLKKSYTCEILTGIPKPRRRIADVVEDKNEWARRFLGDDVIVHTVIREDKIKYCKGPQCILIDDYIKNVKEWRKAGGTAVLFSNPEDTLKEINKLIG